MLDLDLRSGRWAPVVLVTVALGCSPDPGGNDEGPGASSGGEGTTQGPLSTGIATTNTTLQPTADGGTESTTLSTATVGPVTITATTFGTATTLGPATTATDTFSTGETDTDGDGIIMVCSTPGLALPDGVAQGVFDPIMVEAEGIVEEAWVSVAIAHPHVGDIGFRLLHGASNPLLMYSVLDGTGSCVGSDIDVVLRDGAAMPVQMTCGGGSPSIEGELAPNEPLSIFQGMEAAGQWSLQVADILLENEGTLQQWCLMLLLAEGE